MPLVVTSVPNLAQGVSQQPDNLRYPGQCDEQINAWATVVEGLVKRPNTRWINEFNSGATPTNLFTHFVKRDEQNKYCVTVSLGSGTPSLGVINLETGNSIPVATTSIAQSYLSGITNPLADLRALTVADYTFLLNKNKTVATNTVSLGQIPDDEAIVFVKLGDYEKSYSIYIDDGLVPPAVSLNNQHDYTHFTGHPAAQPSTYISGPSGNGQGLYADTEYIAKDLKTCLDAEIGTGAALVGIDAITVNQGGSGYLGGRERVKVEVEVTQPSFNESSPGANDGTASALGIANIDIGSGDTGPIISVDMIRKGTGFSSDQATYPLVFTVNEYVYLGYNGLGWIPRFPSNGSGAAFSVPTNDIISRSNLDITRKGSVIKIKSNDGPFKIRVEDGLSNEGLGLAYQEVASITDLPKSCFNNFSIKVKGDADIDQDDYFVRFSTKDKSEFGEGTWVECVGWTRDESESGELTPIEVKLDETTMPITLVPVLDSNGDVSSFKLQSPEEDQDPTPPAVSGWRERAAGNDETNPFPSFVGGTINDVFFFKNRLGFLTDSNVIFSEADEYFNFFRTTTQQLLDSAPIDVGLSHTKVAVLQHALPFQEKLMLFSDNSQFVLRGADVLSPKTVAISPVTEYDISDGIAPLALGPYIYFPFKRGQYEGLFEYFVDNNTEVFEAEEITSQIPKYIPSKIKQMAGSAAESMVLLQNATDAKTLFVYKYFWSGKEKIQSAWQKWTFDDDVTGFDFIDSTLYLILNGKVLVEMPVENAITDEGLDYTLLLDNRVDGALDRDNNNFPDLAVTYDEETNRTTISNLPDGYGATVDNMTVFTKGGSERNVVASASGTSVEIEGFIASYVDRGGAYVQYDGEYYYCIKTHTSASTFESQYWRKAVYPPEGTPAWSPSVNYFNGTIYRCEINHTSPATFAVGAHWQQTTEVPSAPEWGPNIFYNTRYYFVVGKPYDMLYRFSNQALKQPTERGGRSASDYTYQTIRNASIEYADSGHFTVEVTSRFRDTYSYVYNPAVLSSISTLDRFTPESGHFRFGVQCRPEEATIEVKSSSALPVKLLAAEFESMVTGRSKRYGA